MEARRHQPLLITGCYRSGTTLAEKLLNMHPDMTVASQPFPVLYFLTKELFNQAVGIRRRYPLDHLFLETEYTNGQLVDFLFNHHMGRDAISIFTRRMHAYKQGLWTPEILDNLESLEPGTFFGLYSQLIEIIAGIFASRELSYVGSKEVLMEEFCPALMHHGARIIFIYRDPRAMITSLNFRQRDNLTGEQRPVLYSLRAWRKSVALGVEASLAGRGLLVRYEDLVQNTYEELNRITSFLGLSSFPDNFLKQGIKDQHGTTWKGNSSFADKSGITSDSLLTYREHLPETVLEFIEAVCGPEMKLLSYDFDREGLDVIQSIEQYQDPFRSIHDCFPADYSCNPRRISDEKKRLDLIGAEKLDLDSQRKWFISGHCWSALRKTMQ